MHNDSYLWHATNSATTAQNVNINFNTVGVQHTFVMQENTIVTYTAKALGLLQPQL